MMIYSKKYLRNLKNEEAVTAIEYGLIAAATAVAIYVTVNQIGPLLKGIFDSIVTAL
jgi:Flp pilus assembly pilin Flp